MSHSKIAGILAARPFAVGSAAQEIKHRPRRSAAARRHRSPGHIRLRFGGEVNSVALSTDGEILTPARFGDQTGELTQFGGQILAGAALFSDDMKTVTVGHTKVGNATTSRPAS